MRLTLSRWPTRAAQPVHNRARLRVAVAVAVSYFAAVGQDVLRALTCSQLLGLKTILKLRAGFVKQVYTPRPNIMRYHAKGGAVIVDGAAYLLLLSGAFLMLRLGPAPGSFPRPLPAKTERELAERAASGDLEARNKLIEHNLRLVAHIVKKYYTSAADTEDLISIGTVGLIKGVSTYRPDKGVRLATLCGPLRGKTRFSCTSAPSGARRATSRYNEALDTDSEGNSLSLMDVLAVSDDMGRGAEPQGGGVLLQAARVRRDRADGARAGGLSACATGSAARSR